MGVRNLVDGSCSMNSEDLEADYQRLLDACARLLAANWQRQQQRQSGETDNAGRLTEIVDQDVQSGGKVVNASGQPM